MRIGVFDSGLGGLTVLKSLSSKYPNNEYIYFGDTLNMPYGNKTREKLYELSSKIVEFLIKQKVDLIVIACGTISSNNYQELKKNYNIPIYDILTPTINYLKNNNLNNIGVIATEMTIKSGIFDTIENIVQIACPKFVPLIEKDKINTLEMEEAIKEYLTKDKIDNLVLGCTHYPLIGDKINEVLKRDINFINMGDILTQNIKVNDSQYKLNFYFSKLNSNVLKKLAEMFDNYEIEEMEL
ncbi:MAG: glutamate racemase [Bacilli bacterium]|nr:glutamate racemase [Bacilli bacterium]